MSVGLKTLIQGAIDGYIEQHNLNENPIDGIYAGEISPNSLNNNKLETISVIEDYSKTEIAYEISKGGQSTLQNMVLVCYDCNRGKGDSTLRNFCKVKGFIFEEVCERLESLGKEI